MVTRLVPTGYRYRGDELRAITMTGYGHCTATVKATGEEVCVGPSLDRWAELATWAEGVAIRHQRRQKKKRGPNAKGSDLPG